MEKVLHAMTRKVLSLEEEVKELKKNNTSQGMKVFGNLESMKRQEIDVKTDISDQNIFNPTSSSSPKLKENIPEQKVEKEKVKKSEKKEDIYSCSKCEYKAKKKATLKKHIITKHEVHACKECKETLSSFMELLKHVAKNHSKEPVEESDIKDKGERDNQNKQVEKED